MTYEEYLALLEEDTINESLFRSWEFFEQKIKKFRETIQYPNTYARDANESLDFLQQHDKEYTVKLAIMLYELEHFISLHAKELLMKWDISEHAINTPEAREISDNINDYEYEAWKKKQAERCLKNEVDEESDAEPLTDYDIACMKADEYIKSEKETLEHYNAYVSQEL